MRFAGKRLEDVHEEEVLKRVALGDLVLQTPDRRAWRQIREEDVEPPDGEGASPQIPEIDAVEALEIRFHRAGVIPEEPDEGRQFPSIPSAFWISSKRS